MDVNPVIYPLLLPNGTVSGINSQQKFNPYGLLARGGYYDEFSSQLNSNIRVKQDLDFWKWSKGLSASAMVAFDTYNSRKRKYNRNEPMYTFAGKTDENGIWIEDTLFDEETGDYLYSVLKEADGSLSLQTPEQWSSRTVYTEASLNYDRSFGAHRVGGLLLYNQKVYWDLNATDVIGGMPYKQRGFAGRATYSWNDRYFAESVSMVRRTSVRASVMVSSLLLVWDGQSPMNLSGIRSANTFPSSNSAIRTDGSAVIPQQADASCIRGCSPV